MTTEQLVAEGKQLQRPCVFLKAEGTGPVVGHWYDRDDSSIRRTGRRLWLTVDASQIPNLTPSICGTLSIFTNERGEDGIVEVAPPFLEPTGTPLFAHPAMVLPPVDAVFARGSQAIDEWLSSYGVKRTDRFLSSLKSEAIQEYEKLWALECPLAHRDAFAVLGGWHQQWPDDDFNDLLEDTLLAMTLRDEEPWVEAWRTSSGEFRVIQRIT